jgi:glycosyltransferase involved in cell wall biosynthesis
LVESVAVIVPMFNASATIEATLSSVIAQTYRDIEIIVVDDGSTDNSAALVARIIQKDSRVRLVQQPNLGVAAARNKGAASATSNFLAFVDADDLWAPEKIELQMNALLESGGSVGAVYCWFAVLNADGSVRGEAQPGHAGWVLKELCREHFIGNGSSLLIRRSAFEEVGGYDSSLRANDAQGCEDLLISMRIAETKEIGLVRRHLVGYRLTNHNMSSDVMRMLRSFEIIAAEYKLRYPLYEADLKSHLSDCTYYLLRRALRLRKMREATILLKKLIKLDYPLALTEFPNLVRELFAGMAPIWIRNIAKTRREKTKVFRLYSDSRW